MTWWWSEFWDNSTIVVGEFGFTLNGFSWFNDIKCDNRSQVNLLVEIIEKSTNPRQPGNVSKFLWGPLGTRRQDWIRLAVEPNHPLKNLYKRYQNTVNIINKHQQTSISIYQSISGDPLYRYPSALPITEASLHLHRGHLHRGIVSWHQKIGCSHHFGDITHEFHQIIPSPIHIKHPLKMVPMECGNSRQKTMVSFRCLLFAGKGLLKWSTKRSTKRAVAHRSHRSIPVPVDHDSWRFPKKSATPICDPNFHRIFHYHPFWGYPFSMKPP